jgi:hypothetical protein
VGNVYKPGLQEMWHKTGAEIDVAPDGVQRRTRSTATPGLAETAREILGKQKDDVSTSRMLHRDVLQQEFY